MLRASLNIITNGLNEIQAKIKINLHIVNLKFLKNFIVIYNIYEFIKQ